MRTDPTPVADWLGLAFIITLLFLFFSTLI